MRSSPQSRASDGVDVSDEESRDDAHALPAVSGEALAGVLARNGFTRMRKIGATIWMGQTGGVVAIPAVDVIPAEQLIDLLHAARLSITDFRETLETMGSESE